MASQIPIVIPQTPTGKIEIIDLCTPTLGKFELEEDYSSSESESSDPTYQEEPDSPPFSASPCAALGSRFKGKKGGKFGEQRTSANGFRSVSDSILGTSSKVRKNYANDTPQAQKNAMTFPCGENLRTSPRLQEKYRKECNEFQNVHSKNIGSEEIHEEILDSGRRLSSESMDACMDQMVDQPDETAAENLQADSKASRDPKSSRDGGNSLRPTECSPQSDNSVPTPKQDDHGSKRIPSRIRKSRATQPGDADRDQSNSDEEDVSNMADTPLRNAEDESSPGRPLKTSVNDLTIDVKKIHIELLNKLKANLTQGEIKGSVYILFDRKRPHLHKIGRSKDPYRRKRGIECKCKVDLAVLQTFPVDCYVRTESVLHLYFQDLRQTHPCECGTKHEEWFLITEELVTDALAKWVRFMREELPYDLETRQVHPFFSYWIQKQESFLIAGDKNADTMRQHWDRMMVPTWFDRFYFRFDLIRNFVWKFYWPFNTAFAWTVAFIMAPHPVLFVLMGWSVIGTFMCMSDEFHNLRSCLRGSKKKLA